PLLPTIWCISRQFLTRRTFPRRVYWRRQDSSTASQHFFATFSTPPLYFRSSKIRRTLSMLDSFTSRLGWLDSLLTAMALEVLTVTQQFVASKRELRPQ